MIRNSLQSPPVASSCIDCPWLPLVPLSGGGGISATVVLFALVAILGREQVIASDCI